MSESKPTTVKMINLTPHDITVVTKSGQMEIPASGEVARVLQGSEHVFDIGEAPVHSTPMFGEINWPEFDHKAYDAVIVSMVVGNAVRALPKDERPTMMVLGPDTSPASAVRGEDGQIESVRRLVLYSKND